MAMPRMNLSLISWRINYAACSAVTGEGEIAHLSEPECERFRNFNFNLADVVSWDLPYELVVIAVRGKNASAEHAEENETDRYANLVKDAEVTG
jgi:hypothetical protein